MKPYSAGMLPPIFLSVLQRQCIKPFCRYDKTFLIPNSVLVLKSISGTQKASVLGLTVVEFSPVFLPILFSASGCFKILFAMVLSSLFACLLVACLIFPLFKNKYVLPRTFRLLLFNNISFVCACCCISYCSAAVINTVIKAT